MRFQSIVTSWGLSLFIIMGGATGLAQKSAPVAPSQVLTGKKVSSQTQIETDVRAALKDLLLREQQNYAEEARYKPQAELNYRLPSSLEGLVKLSISFAGMNREIKIQLDGVADPILGKKYVINETGTISGASQFVTDTGLDQEIQNLMRGADAAMKSYFAEWNMYSTDFQKIGLEVPAHLKKIGNLNIQLTNSGYSIEYLGTAAPIQGKRFKFLPPKAP